MLECFSPDILLFVLCHEPILDQIGHQQPYMFFFVVLSTVEQSDV